MKQKIKLRPHHLLCLQFFRGKGYSADFTQNMQKITMNLGNDFEIVQGADDCCAHCPHLVEGKCTSGKPEKYDQKLLELCSNLDLATIKQLIKEHKWQTICSDCEWYEFCLKVSEENV